MSDWTSDEGLDKLLALHGAATGNHWYWNGYSDIFATGLASGSEFDLSEPEEEPYEPPFGIVAVIAKPPRDRGRHGDQLASQEAQSNAKYVEAAMNAVPVLIEEIQRLRATR